MMKYLIVNMNSELHSIMPNVRFGQNIVRILHGGRRTLAHNYTKRWHDNSLLMTLLNEIVVYKNVNNIEIACNNNKKRSFPLNSYGQSWVVQCVVRWVCCQVIYGHWPYYWNVMDEIWTDKTLKSTLSMIQYRNATPSIIFTVLHRTVFDPSTPKNVA